MNKLKYMVMALLLGGATYSANAQSNNFSQYHLTPLYTSPAELGTSDYFQVLSHYRKQSLTQDQGFENIALSGTYPLYYKDGGRRFGGIGISIMNESSGTMGMLQENSLRAGYAYNWQVNKSHHVSFGLLGGYYRRNMDIGKASTDSQYQNGSYNPGNDLGEHFTKDASQAFKADIGATWYAVDEYGDRKFSLGLAAFNVNKSNYEFLIDSREQVAPIRYQAYGSIRAIAKDRVQVVPTFRFMVEKNYSQLNLGSLFLYQLKEEQAGMHESHLGLGAWYSLDNAAIFSLEYAQPSYIVSIGYDLPASSNIDQMQVNNGVEVTFGWRLNKGKKRKAALKPAPEAVGKPHEEKPAVEKPEPEVKSIIKEEKPAVEKPEPEVKPIIKEEKSAVEKPEPEVKPIIKEEKPAVERPEPEVKSIIKEEKPAVGTTIVEVEEPVVKEQVLTRQELELFDETIHFEIGKQGLTTSSKELLNKVSDILQANPMLKVSLTGHTDNTGRAESNKQISLIRAERSRDYLVQKGIAINRISVKGMGQEHPVATNTTPEGRESNRRVEIHIVE